MSFRKISRSMLLALLPGMCRPVTRSGPIDYPSKPITLIIPLGAGGSHDLNARVFTSVIPSYLGQAVVVKLMPGAGGTNRYGRGHQSQTRRIYPDLHPQLHRPATTPP